MKLELFYWRFKTTDHQVRFRRLKANLDSCTTYHRTNNTCLSLIKGNKWSRLETQKPVKEKSTNRHDLQFIWWHGQNPVATSPAKPNKSSACIYILGITGMFLDSLQTAQTSTAVYIWISSALRLSRERASYVKGYRKYVHILIISL